MDVQSSFLRLVLVFPSINNHPDYDIWNIGIDAYDNTFCSKCGQT